MSTSIIFKNLAGTILTSQQTLISKYYSKEYSTDGKLYKIENYENSQLSGGAYFLSGAETLLEVVTQFNNIWPNGGQFYYNKQQIGEYSLWDWECYKGLDITSKGKAVFNDQMKFITYQKVDVSTLEIKETSKYYRLSNFEDFETDTNLSDYGKLEFIYRPEENIQVTIGLSGFEDDIYTIDEDDNILYNPLLTPLFSWDDETFYHSAEPLVPGQ
jgi:hypothetical protein